MSLKDRAKISYLDNAGTYYYTSSVHDCHDDTDKNIYMLWLADKERKPIQMGMVVVEAQKEGV
jgi:hypothetical protein